MNPNLVPGGHPPPETLPISQPKALFKSAFILPKQAIGSGSSLFLGRPEADLREGLSRLIVEAYPPPQELS